MRKISPTLGTFFVDDDGTETEIKHGKIIMILRVHLFSLKTVFDKKIFFNSICNSELTAHANIE